MTSRDRDPDEYKMATLTLSNKSLRPYIDEKYGFLYPILPDDLIQYVFNFLDNGELFYEYNIQPVWDDFIDDYITIPKGTYNRLYHSKYKYCLYNCRNY
jgi:hypothetical protein